MTTELQHANAIIAEVEVQRTMLGTRAAHHAATIAVLTAETAALRTNRAQLVDANAKLASDLAAAQQALVDANDVIADLRSQCERKGADELRGMVARIGDAAVGSPAPAAEAT